MKPEIYKGNPFPGGMRCKAVCQSQQRSFPGQARTVFCFFGAQKVAAKGCRVVDAAGRGAMELYAGGRFPPRGCAETLIYVA